MSVDPMAFTKAREAAIEVADMALIFEEKMEALLVALKDLPMSSVIMAVEQGCDTPERSRSFSSIWTRITTRDERFTR